MATRFSVAGNKRPRSASNRLGEGASFSHYRTVGVQKITDSAASATLGETAVLGQIYGHLVPEPDIDDTCGVSSSNSVLSDEEANDSGEEVVSGLLLYWLFKLSMLFSSSV